MFAILLAAPSIALQASPIDQSGLTPMTPYGSNLDAAYKEIVFKSLLGTGYFDLWMMVFATLKKSDVECAIAIGRRAAPGPRQLRDLDFFVTVTCAKTRITLTGLPLGKSAGAKRKNEPSKVDVMEEESDLPAEVAKRFIETWHSALREAHYSDSPSGTDGITYAFYANGRAAEAWTPDRESIAGLMAESGECLRKYVRAPAQEKSDQLAQCRYLLLAVKGTLAKQ